MAGGDAALVRSIERFEDYPEYGARQLRELGFRDGDLMVATTRGWGDAVCDRRGGRGGAGVGSSAVLSLLQSGRRYCAGWRSDRAG